MSHFTLPEVEVTNKTKQKKTKQEMTSPEIIVHVKDAAESPLRTRHVHRLMEWGVRPGIWFFHRVQDITVPVTHLLDEHLFEFPDKWNSKNNWSGFMVPYFTSNCWQIQNQQYCIYNSDFAKTPLLCFIFNNKMEHINLAENALIKLYSFLTSMLMPLAQC